MAKEKNKKKQPQQVTKTAQNASVAVPKTSTFSVPKWLPLTLILVATALFRLQYLDIPLERDESFYSYIGKLALSGGKPYIDFYEMKPPVLFYSYAILVGIFGYSGTGIHLAATALAVGNTYFTYAIAKKLGGQQVAYLSAIAYSIWSLSSGVYGAYLMSENVQLIWGLPAILLALNLPNQVQSKQLYAVGFLLAMSFLVKQTSAVLAILVAFFWLSHWFSNRRDTLISTYLKPILWTFLGFFTPILFTIVGLWAIGSGQDAKFWLLDYPRIYSTDLSSEEATMAFNLMKQLVFTAYTGYFIIPVLGIMSVFLSKKSLSEKSLLIAWAVLSVFTVTLGRRFYGHYWLFALPILSILGGFFFQELSIWLRQKMGGIEAKIVFFLGFLWSIHAFFTQSDLYFAPNLADISRKYSPGNPYLEHQVLANYLEKIIQPNDHLAVFGSDPQYFIYLNKISPLRHTYFAFLTNPNFEKGQSWQAETIENFKKTKPEYVILNKYPFAWMYKPGADQGLYDGLYGEVRMNYELVAFIENPGENAIIDIKTPINKNLMPTTPSYIAVLKRRAF
jgi:hypothetical protein